MAGDWVKIEKATARKPEVLRIADMLNIHPDQAFGLCVRFWFWCDDQMTDGHAASVTNVTLDLVFGHTGFASALISVGWLRVREGSLEVPNFDRHLSESAKNRALSGERKRKQRVKDDLKLSRSERDKSVTREEKRREENSNPLSHSVEEFCEIVGRAIPTGLKQLIDGYMIPEQHRTAACVEKLAEYVSWCGRMSGRPLDAITLRNRLAAAKVEQWSAERLIASLQTTIGKGETRMIYDSESKPPARTSASNPQGLSLAEMVASLPAMEGSE